MRSEPNSLGEKIPPARSRTWHKSLAGSRRRIAVTAAAAVLVLTITGAAAAGVFSGFPAGPRTAAGARAADRGRRKDRGRRRNGAGRVRPALRQQCR